MLEEALKDPSWTAALEQEGNYEDYPPAIIMDIDETALDNSPFEAQMIKANVGFKKSLWKKWLSRSVALPVPGAVEFVKHAESKGVEIFFVTNRNSEFDSVTRKNLQKAGFPAKLVPNNVLMRNGWPSDKSSRRALVAKNYRILLLIGDDLNDFVPVGKKTPEERVELAEDYASYWGKRWLLLPNPLYGSWERALYGYEYGLSDSEKLKRKYEMLRPFE
jgi:acid phosphatase